MKTKLIFDESFSFLEQRLGQILCVAIACWVALLLNSLFFQDAGELGLFFLGVRVSILITFLGALSAITALLMLNSGKEKSAGVVYILGTAIILTFGAFALGGLQSSSILVFPVLLIFAALFTSRNTLIAMCIAFIIVVVILGQNEKHGWFITQAEEGGRLVRYIIIIAFSGYIIWLFESDLRAAFVKQQQKHQQLLKSKQLIQTLAYQDSLTGLLNRAGVAAKYNDFLSCLSDANKRIVFFFIDLDNFKSINDLFDHDTGDELLQTVANRLKALEGENAVAGRVGGDEFVFFVIADEAFDMNAFASQMIRSAAKPHFILGAEAEVTASIGIAVVSEVGVSFSDASKQADKAMYKAKQLGKNKYQHYSDELNQEYMRSLTILNSLKSALKDRLLDLHFQPKVNLVTREVEGAEALLRWNRGNPESIQPSEFIPVIESTELIHDIGAWVIQQSCLACKEWHDAGHEITVSANVSSRQLTRENFSHIVADALRASCLAPQFLEVEMTEHGLIQENHVVKAQLQALKSLGVKLAIDDFGTGYSNMKYLTHLQVDVLKLDQSYVSQLECSKEALLMVTAIIEMADVLGMTVVAEGIESESICEKLEGLGCAIGQGYLWSKAAPSDELLRLLMDNKRKNI